MKTTSDKTGMAVEYSLDSDPQEPVVRLYLMQKPEVSISQIEVHSAAEVLEIRQMLTDAADRIIRSRERVYSRLLAIPGRLLEIDVTIRVVFTQEGAHAGDRIVATCEVYLPPFTQDGIKRFHPDVLFDQRVRIGCHAISPGTRFYPIPLYKETFATLGEAKKGTNTWLDDAEKAIQPFLAACEKRSDAWRDE